MKNYNFNAEGLNLLQMAVYPTLKILIKCAETNSIITYEQLKLMTGYRSPRMGRVLEIADNTLCKLSKKSGKNIPIIGGFVIDKNKNKPNDGLKKPMLRKGYNYDVLKRNNQLTNIIKQINEEAHNYNWTWVKNQLYL